MFSLSYLSDPHRTGENRLPARELLLPAQKRGVTHKNFTASDRVRLLSGDWRFFYREEDDGEPFYEPERDDGAWDTLPVPAMWQFHGYGTCYYPNVRYCFPYDPPYIHCPNPVGLYRKRFTAEKPTAGRAVLRFLGVDNAYCVWLNGQYVGFSKGSRIPAEFDATPYLVNGENLLAVKVWTYSDGSYLENQDMLMASGIFRDVYLVYTGENALWDYTLLPDRTGFAVGYEAVVGETPAALRLTLCGADGAELAVAEQPLAAKGEAFLPLANAIEWNAERPYLYTVYFEILENGVVTETHTKRAGIAASSIEGYYLKLNGKHITLKGVNRHENNAREGRAITAAQIERELRDIKNNHLNAIRCSHYTNQPVFYEMASELGIYVMDEADCESHGAEASGDQGVLNKDPEWFDAFFDRISRMYLLHKNETCVNIWSVGNECGDGVNDERCAKWLREREVKKVVRDAFEQKLDEPASFIQTGYMPMKTLRDSSPADGRPLLLLEYAHAMGNSPGGLEDIWNWIYENEHCCGGYVWEFKSHGFYVEGRNGRPRYLYGGDFPDVYHWSNFSLDGYHTSDGTPKASWAELKEVSAPVWVKWEDGGAAVKNTYDFLPLDGIVMRWSVRADGETVRGGEYALDGLAPRAWKRFPLLLATEGLAGLVTADCEFFRGGERIAHKQKILADLPKAAPAPVPFAHTVKQTGNDVTVTGEDFTVTFRKGLLCRIVKGGRTLLDAPVRLNCRRAPTDNDGIIGFSERLAGEWKDKLVHTMLFGCYETAVADAPDRVTVTATGKFLPYCHNWGFDAKLTYTITAGGAAEIAVSLVPYGEGGPEVLPRVGVVLELDGAYRRCEWLGRGPGENYPDCRANAPVGRYEADVAEMNFLYDVPQETGNHEDCRRATISGGGLSLTAEGAFSFSFHDFTLEDLTKARHCDELEKSERRYWYIDHRMRGLGSNSCGPQPEQEYELPMGAFAWSFRLTPGESFES
ncbi:MAG: hypothetical protein IJK89_12960 [Clostridia bacterium]|nr:hypothetical protein [Clostridia bacterium]